MLICPQCCPQDRWAVKECAGTSRHKVTLKNKELCALRGGIWNRVGRGETDEWWPETGLNRRRRPFQGRALPLSYLASVQTSRCNFCAESEIAGDGGRALTRGANPWNTALKTTSHSIPTPIVRAKPGARESCPKVRFLLYTGKQSCALLPSCLLALRLPPPFSTPRHPLRALPHPIRKCGLRGRFRLPR